MKGERCANCMKELNGYDLCPHCGYDNTQARELTFVLAPNTILNGKYLIGRVLGQGGFGITYVGLDLALERRVAVKEYYPAQQVSRNNTISNNLTWNSTLVSSEQWAAGREGFLREARKMAKLVDIPEIVKVHDVFNENNTAYIVMDYVEGETLKARLERRGTMPYAEAVSLLLPLIRALDMAHAQGMIHRDISPDNIMIRKDGRLRLLDFGAAKDLTAQNASYSVRVAKNGFSPFEQYISTGSIGPWTDVYAMCATLYYAVTGRLPPEAPGRMDRDDLSFEGIPTGPLSPKQQAVLRDGLGVLPRDRVQSMAELAERLEDSLDRVEFGSAPAFPQRVSVPVGQPMTKPLPEERTVPIFPVMERVSEESPGPEDLPEREREPLSKPFLFGIYFLFAVTLMISMWRRMTVYRSAALAVFGGFVIVRQWREKRRGRQALGAFLAALMGFIVFFCGYFVCVQLLGISRYVEPIGFKTFALLALMLIICLAYGVLMKRYPESSMLNRVLFMLAGMIGFSFGEAYWERMPLNPFFMDVEGIAAGIFLGVLTAIILTKRGRGKRDL